MFIFVLLLFLDHENLSLFCIVTIFRPRKLLHSMKDETFKQGDHELTGMQQLSEQIVRYDLDDLDVCWLQSINKERMGLG